MRSHVTKFFMALFLASLFFVSCSTHGDNKSNQGQISSPKAGIRFHHKGVLDVYPVDAHKLLSVGRDSLLLLWQADSGWVLKAKKMPEVAEAIGYDARQKRWWLVGKGGNFYRISGDNGSVEGTVSTVLTDVRQIAYSRVLRAFFGFGSDGVFAFYPGEKKLRIIDRAEAAIAVHGFQPLLAVFKRQRIDIRDGRTQKSIKTLTLPGYESGNDKERFVAFVGKSGLIATYGENMWWGNWQQGKMHRLSKEHHAPITALAVCQTDSLIATGSMDKSIKLWRWPKGDLRGSLYGHFQTVNSLAFADSGKKLISASEDGTIIIWNVKTNLQEKRLGSLKIAVRNPWYLTVKSVRYARSFKAGGEEYNVSDAKTRLIKVTAEITNRGLADNLFFSSNLFLTAPDQSRFHCVGLEHYVALAPKAYFKRRIAPRKSLKGNFIFIITPPYQKYTITYETLKPIPLKDY